MKRRPGCALIAAWEAASVRRPEEASTFVFVATTDMFDIRELYDQVDFASSAGVSISVDKA